MIADDLDALYFNASVFSDENTPELKESIDHYVRYYKRTNDYKEIYSGEDLFGRMVDHEDYLPSACLQILNREFLNRNHISFHEGILHEDELFTFISMLQAKRAGYMNEAFYGRRIRADSIMMAKKSFKNVYGYFVGCEKMKAFLNETTLSDQAYKAACEKRNQLYRLAYRYYKDLSDEEKLTYKKLTVIERRRFEREFLGFYEQLESFNETIQNLKEENKEVTGERDHWKQELMNVKSGYSFRIGRVITFVPRKLLGK